jgi:hypothetical protein
LIEIWKLCRGKVNGYKQAMTLVNRLNQTVTMILVLFIVLAVTTTTTPAQEQLADLMPLLGKWRGYVTTKQGTVPTELTIQADGSWATVVYVRPTASFKGTMQVVDGKAH